MKYSNGKSLLKKAPLSLFLFFSFFWSRRQIPFSVFLPFSLIVYVLIMICRRTIQYCLSSNLTRQKRFASQGWKVLVGKDVARYSAAAAIGFLGLTFASVPLYRIYCQATGQAGQQGFLGSTVDQVENMKITKDRRLRVSFVADAATDLLWEFKPVQHSIEISPGETTLAFFTAKNPLNESVVGMATYTVLPFEAAKYLNKIQCFCFEEQRLNPGEEVDLPVFFYIDPSYNDDARLDTVTDIILSYTFFVAKEGIKLPFIGQMTPLPS